jgi:hypothetical protein
MIINKRNKTIRRITQKSRTINGKMNSDHMKGGGGKDAATPYHV